MIAQIKTDGACSQKITNFLGNIPANILCNPAIPSKHIGNIPNKLILTANNTL